MSSAEAMPSFLSSKASASKAPCKRLTTKPGISFVNSMGTLFIERMISFTRWVTAPFVKGAGTTSTAGMRWGGLIG